MASLDSSLGPCGVCSQQENGSQKYRCRRCPVRFCSAPCYKTHSEECKDSGESEEARSPPLKRSSMIFLDEEEDTILPPEKLKLLSSSTEVRRTLSNPHLRRFLSHVDATHNPSGFVRLAMREPLFVEFADACLRAVHPETATSNHISDEKIQEMVRETIEGTEDD